MDEAVEPVDFEAPADLVAITFHTPSAPHAYATADAQFRNAPGGDRAAVQLREVRS